ncbi:sigma 54-interacting transcriptional regulator [Pseudomonas indica]|uniref:sigma 54-interacting transcriptional regulator n=1 Tax=Pseudomonas indica TaxID=137658 RepID=UPI003FD642B0
MTFFTSPALLTLSDADRSPLSIRARALVFADPTSQRLRAEVERLAASTLPVLIQGETGSGKELLARHIHRSSDRQGLFVAVNCGALSPTHAEAELFGHVAGARAGTAGRAGWFGSANGGSLYLDEIGDLPLSLQAKLLAALENREVMRVGAQRPNPLDVRLLAATSIDLVRAVEAGTFDERLYLYLSEGRLNWPPLRERVGDILPLAEYFLGIYAQRLGLSPPLLSPEAQRQLEGYIWPGNTRELENVIHFALLVSKGGDIQPEHLGPANPMALIERQLERLQASPSLQEPLREILARSGVMPDR